MQQMFPTPYPAVNALAGALRDGAGAVLGAQFVGLYLHGSLALGAFDPCRSDIDFVVVTVGDLPDEMVAALADMHRGIASSDLTWKTNYEGSYIPAGALVRYEPAWSVHPVVRVDGSFGMDRHGSDWVIQRHIIRERGIVVVGPSPDGLIDPVTADDLRRATRSLLQEWWLPQLCDPFRLQSSEYQAYAILTMCRVLYTFETGTVAAKPEAARWAQQRLGSPWAELIGVALAWRHGADLDCLEGAVEFIRYTLGKQ